MRINILDIRSYIYVKVLGRVGGTPGAGPRAARCRLKAIVFQVLFCRDNRLIGYALPLTRLFSPLFLSKQYID